MRIFITGATGAIGRRVVPRLVEAGHDVTGVGRTPEKRSQLERLGVRGVAVDLFDPAQVTAAVHGIDVICNLATAVPRSTLGLLLPWPWHEMDRIRRQVSANLVSAAISGGSVRRVIQESFAPIYAANGSDWITETSPVAPARYDRSTLDAEANADRFARSGGAGVSLRFGMLYGPGDKATLTFLDSIRRGWFPLFGKPEAYCSWTAHEDAAGAVIAALEVPSGRYNVVEDQPECRRDLGDGLARLLGKGPPKFLPAWVARFGGVIGETLARSLRISNHKLREVGKWVPRHPRALDGMAEILEGMRAGARSGA